MTTKVLLILTCTIFVFGLNAQSLSPEVVSPGGDISQSETMALEWTLGELAVDYLPAKEMIISEGFHQPILEVVELPTDWFSNLKPTEESDTGSNLDIEVWPNPVQTSLNIKINSTQDEAVFIEVIDGLGRSVVAKSSYASNGSYNIDFSDKVSGSYLIRFTNEDGTLIKTILNIKH